MATFCSLRAPYLLLVLCVLQLITSSHASHEERKVYIVYMGKLDETVPWSSSHHLTMLQEVVHASYARKSLVRSYTRSFNGFAANLTAQEQEKLAGHKSVLLTFPSTTYQLHTTRSWDFMGVTENVLRDPTVESDMIIGVLDTGVWPESESFNDQGFGPPPEKWKGVCKGGVNFTCNKKLIGTRYYDSGPLSEVVSARDTIGHGTHTASIAAGNYVKDASLYGIAKGTARGGIPSARIAAYKVCPSSTCKDEDVLAAFDDSIADGVDIISISFGTNRPVALEDSVTAIGSYHATQKGILVVQSAGNTGSLRSVSSIAPWIFAVAASSTDREIVSTVSLGNGTTLLGRAVNSFRLDGTNFPLVYGKEASSACHDTAAQYCFSGCLKSSLVKGKIVLCKRLMGMGELSRVGALGSIVLDEEADYSSVVPYPLSELKAKDFDLAVGYFNTTKVPTVDLLTSETLKNLDAPRVASFSSRGPNFIIPDIMKPDVTAPGVEILAAFSPLASPSGYSMDTRSVSFNILSGTSMACPHVAGAAAYVKSMHPHWSSSAIKSALMTTAWRMSAAEDPNAELSYGSGHIDPVKATDPGLVYEILPEDYAKMLCSLGGESSRIRKGYGLDCTDGVKLPKDMNYPSLTVQVIITEQSETMTFLEKFTRTVTNVGLANSTYKVTTSRSSQYNITVNPSILAFGALNEKKSFEVTVSGKVDNNKMISASLEWSDGVHNVRSPIVVYPSSMLNTM